MNCLVGHARPKQTEPPRVVPRSQWDETTALPLFGRRGEGVIFGWLVGQTRERESGRLENSSISGSTSHQKKGQKEKEWKEKKAPPTLLSKEKGPWE